MPPPPPPLQPVGQRAGLLVEPDQLPQSLALDHRTGELGGEEGKEEVSSDRSHNEDVEQRKRNRVKEVKQRETEK